MPAKKEVKKVIVKEPKEVKKEEEVKEDMMSKNYVPDHGE